MSQYVLGVSCLLLVQLLYTIICLLSSYVDIVVSYNFEVERCILKCKTDSCLPCLSRQNHRSQNRQKSAGSEMLVLKESHFRGFGVSRSFWGIKMSG